jgi:hypothetical protein
MKSLKIGRAEVLSITLPSKAARLRLEQTRILQLRCHRRKPLLRSFVRSGLG